MDIFKINDDDDDDDDDDEKDVLIPGILTILFTLLQLSGHMQNKIGPL